MTGRYYTWGKSYALSGTFIQSMYQDYFYSRTTRNHAVSRPVRRKWAALKRGGYKGFPFSLRLNSSLTHEEQKELYKWSIMNQLPGEIIITDVVGDNLDQVGTHILASDENALVMLKIKYG